MRKDTAFDDVEGADGYSREKLEGEGRSIRQAA